MIQYLLFDTSKLLNISDITKRIGNFFKLPIQLSWGIAYPELAFIVSTGGLCRFKRWFLFSVIIYGSCGSIYGGGGDCGNICPKHNLFCPV